MPVTDIYDSSRIRLSFSFFQGFVVVYIFLSCPEWVFNSISFRSVDHHYLLNRYITSPNADTSVIDGS